MAIFGLIWTQFRSKQLKIWPGSHFQSTRLGWIDSIGSTLLYRLDSIGSTRSTRLDRINCKNGFLVKF